MVIKKEKYIRKIKKLLIAFFIIQTLAIINALNVWADEIDIYETEVGVETEESTSEAWSVTQNEEGKIILTVYSDSAMAGDDVKEWNSYNSSVKEVVIESGVTYIGTNAFANFHCMGKVTIPDSVTEIREGAFDGCTVLTDIDIPAGLKKICVGTFKDCLFLKSFRIPKEIEVIEKDAFLGCEYLDYLIVPQTVTEIGDHAIGMKYDVGKNEYSVIDTFTMYGYNDVAKSYAQQNGVNYVDLSEREDYEYWKQYTSDYYYNQLTQKEQIIWDELEEICYHYLGSQDDFVTGVDIKISDVYSFEKNEWPDFFHMFRMSHPQFYFLSNVSGMEMDERTPLVGQFEVYKKFRDGKARQIATQQFKEQLEDWYAIIALGTTDEEILRILTGIICKDISYDSYDSYYTQGAWDAVCTKKTVCEGYVLAMQLLCLRSGIESVCVGAEGHAYNIVKLNDTWFNVDVTWMDSDNDSENVYLCETVAWNDYYLISDAEFGTSSSHQPDYFFAPYVPSCPKTEDKQAWLSNPHIAQVIPAVDETCLTDGKTEGATCLICSKVLKEPQSIKANGHIRDAGTTQENGMTVYKCTECGEIVFAQGSINNYVWSINATTGEMIFNGTGDLKYYDDWSHVPYKDIKNCVKSVVISEGITNIGGNAFCGFSNLESVVVPDSVKTIQIWAFGNCVALKHISIPSVEGIDGCAFKGCTNLEEIELGKELTKIDSEVFRSCTNLKEIYISEKIQCINKYAFKDCTSLSKVIYGGNQTSWNNLQIGDYNECLLDADINFEKKDNISVVDPSKEGDFILCGVAENTDDGILLTKTEQYVSGGVFTNNLINIKDDFEISFDFCMDGGNANSSQGNGADGITVSFSQKRPGVLGTGGSIAFTGRNSFGVQYDTWWNYQYNDIKYDHVAIIKNNENTHIAYKNFPNTQLDDGNWHSTTIQYIGTKMKVYMDGELICDCEKSQIQNVSSAYICISASTGSFVNNHKIKNISMNGRKVDICGYTRNNLQNKKMIEGDIASSNAWISIKDGQLTFMTDIYNMSKDDFDTTLCDIVLYDKDGKQIIFSSNYNSIPGIICAVASGEKTTLSAGITDTTWDINDYKIVLNQTVASDNYLWDNHYFCGLDFNDGKVVQSENDNIFEVIVENNSSVKISEQCIVTKFFDNKGKTICNVESSIPLIAPGEKSNLSIVLPKSASGLYDYVIVKKGTENLNYDFDKDLYRALYLNNLDNPTSSAWNKMVCSEGPTSILLNSLDSDSFKNSVDAWTVVQQAGSMMDNPANVIDVALRERDIYSALILDVLYKKSKENNKVFDTVKNIESMSNKVASFMKSDYAINNALDFLDGKDFEDIKWSSLSLDEKRNFMESFEEAYKKAHPNVSKAGDFISKIDKIVKVGSSLKECLDYVIAYVELYNMSEAQKDIILRMYKQCPTENSELRSALLDCYSTISASNEEFYMKLTYGTCMIAGREIVNAWTGVYWEIVEKSLKASHPYVAMYWYSFKLSSYATDILYNVDDICEKYYCMVAMQELRNVAQDVYEMCAEEYEINKVKSNAQYYLASADIMYKIIDSDCGYAKKFVESVDGGWVAKLHNYFGDKRLEEKIKDIEFIQKQDEIVYKSMLLGWIYGLESDYPEEYVKYRKYLEDENFELSKLYEIACPVDIYVFDNNDNMVASVINNVPTVHDDTISISVMDDKKNLYFTKKANDYTIAYVGTDEGEMDITVSEFEKGIVERKIQFNRVELSTLTQYISKMTSETNIANGYVLENLDNIVVNPDYDSISCNSIGNSNKKEVEIEIINGFVSRNGEIFTKGKAFNNEKVNLCAVVHENEKFIRWDISNNDTQNKAYIRDEAAINTDLYLGESNCTIMAIVEKINDKTEPSDKDNPSSSEIIGDGQDAEPNDEIEKPNQDKDNSNVVSKIKLSKIVISAPSKKLAVGKKVNLKVKATPGNAENLVVNWKSSNTKYATIDSGGKLTLKKAGAGKSVTITAIAKDGSGVKATYKIKIMKHAVKSIKLKAPAKTLKAGKSMQLKTSVKTTGKQANKTLQWLSSNTKYATVSKTGKVKASKEGKGKTVTITARATDGSGKKASVKIKIK